jgi:alpha-L-rhamnosidase
LGNGTGPIEWQSMFLKLQYLLHRYYFSHSNSTYLIRKFYEPSFRFISFLSNVAFQNDFIIESGLGDWSSIAVMNVPYTSTIFLYENFLIFSGFAKLVGDQTNATYFENMAKTTKKKIIQTFFNYETGCFSNCTQADQAFALEYEIYETKEEKQQILNRLLNDLNETNVHFTTGIWGTKFLLNNLCKEGFCDVSMQLFTQTDFPSFGNMIEMGATSVWEVWFYSDNVYSHVRAHGEEQKKKEKIK